MPGICATVAAGIVVVGQLGTLYDVFSPLVIVPAEAREDGPFQVAPGQPPLPLMANLLAESVETPEAEQRLREAGATAEYDVAVEAQGPVLRVSTIGEDPESAIRTAQLVIDAIRQELADRATNITAETLTSPDQAVPVAPSESSPAGGFLTTSAVLLTGGTDGAARVNPLGQLGLSTSAVIAEITRRETFEDQLKDSGATSDYEVLADPLAPILRVTTTDRDPERAVKTMMTLVDTLNTEMAERQEALGAPRDTWLAVESVLNPRAEAVAGRKLRALLAVLGLGGIATLGLAVLAEGLSFHEGLEGGPSGFDASDAQVDVKDDQSRHVTRTP
ncbi:MAG: hypothetical protein ACRD0K_03675 [Egibacteraceae bacterium]